MILGSYLRQSFKERVPKTVDAVREAVVAAGKRRIRPCLMTSATTILALITVFVVPTLYSALEEFKLRRGNSEEPDLTA